MRAKARAPVLAHHQSGSFACDPPAFLALSRPAILTPAPGPQNRRLGLAVLWPACMLCRAMPARIMPEKFAVAFSCAGEQRALVRTIALSVEAVVGLGSVFFDEWFEHYIAGDDADLVLQDIYGKRSELVVVCFSFAVQWQIVDTNRSTAPSARDRWSSSQRLTTVFGIVCFRYALAMGISRGCCSTPSRRTSRAAGPKTPQA